MQQLKDFQDERRQVAQDHVASGFLESSADAQQPSNPQAQGGPFPGMEESEPVVAAPRRPAEAALLTQLGGIGQVRKQPFVLCLDQVDNLDQEQVAALARFLEALIDSSPNLLVVTSGVQAME